ncbi:MAG TPA: DUF2252 family protein [Puia sp.]|nr:DUF2252 family protein [Puia sp.]
MDDLASRILDFNKDRIRSLVGLKYEAMAENMYRFFRGTNHIFFGDMTTGIDLPPSPNAWISGDLHLENFGSYKSDNRLVYFDLNDFDEGFLAPVIWDLYRMVVSILIAFASLGIEEEKAERMGKLFLKTYSDTLMKGKADYIEPKTAKGIVCEFLTAVSKRKQRDILRKKTVKHKNKLEILLDDPKHLGLKKSLKKDLMNHITAWLKNDSNSPYNYKVMDAVFRLAGTASLGTTRFAILLKSLNTTGEKYLLLDMKEAIPSSLEPYSDVRQPAWLSEADRIVTVQRYLQNRSPALLSTTEFRDRHFVIQEIQPAKDKINFKLIKKEYRSIYQVIADMASLTAYAHLRSSGRQGSAIADDLISFGKETNWQDDVFHSAVRYAFQLENDYKQYMADYRSGIFKVEHTEDMKISA